jgi:hypothetical protein
MNAFITRDECAPSVRDECAGGMFACAKARVTRVVAAAAAAAARTRSETGEAGESARVRECETSETGETAETAERSSGRRRRRRGGSRRWRLRHRTSRANEIRLAARRFLLTRVRLRERASSQSAQPWRRPRP